MERNSTRLGILRSSLEAVAGLIVFAIGIYLVIQAGIGVAPWDVFCIGLSYQTGFLYGTCSILISCAIILIDALLLREKIGLGMILDTIVVGKTIDFLNWLDLVHKPDSLWIAIVMLLIGFLIEGFGQYLYIRDALGCGPRDAFQMGLGKRMPKVPIGVVNIMILAVVFVIGWLLGGPVGIGTLIAPVGIGLTQQLAFTIFKFDPKAVKHQDVIESARIIFNKQA